MLRLGISGVCGKMGKRIAALAAMDPDIKITVAIDKKGIPEAGKDLGVLLGGAKTGVMISSDLREKVKDMDCLIEFTLPDATQEHLEVCRAGSVPMVIGTTGLDDAGEENIKKASCSIPVVFSPNMAPGVNLLFNIVRETARVLGRDFDIKIDETHHVHKKDSPSGTARMIAKVIKGSTGRDIPIEAFREGEVIGNHGVIFDGKYEKIELRHDAKTRDVFASGAIRAAKFLSGKQPGLYNMSDVLGLNAS